MPRRIILYLLIFLLTVANILIPWPSQAEEIESTIPTVTSNGVAAFRWDKTTLGDLGGSASAGSINIPELGNRAWSSGDRLSDIFTLGDIQDSPVPNLSLNEVENLTGQKLKDLAIDEFRLVASQSVADLVSEIPGLGDLELGAVQPIANLVDQKLKAIGSQKLQDFVDRGISDLLGETNLLENLKLGDLPIDQLQNLSIDSIPGLSDIPLSNLNGWTEEVLAAIPGLEKLPIGMVFNLPNFSPMATVDVVWGPKEADNSVQIISGSQPNQWSKPCDQGRCAYLELTQKGHKGDRWNAGGKDEELGQQMVEGGSGILKKVFDGKEPTGRPLGKDFKLVLMETNESEGTASIGLTTRICKRGIPDLGCTPLAIGPWKIMTVKEKGSVFLGIPPGQEVDVDIPPEVQGQIDQIKNNLGLNSSGASGNSGISNEELNKECVLKLLKKVPPDQLNMGDLLLSGVLNQSRELELNEAQTSFAIAYALNNFEPGKTSSSASTHFGHRKTLLASRSGLQSLSGAARTEYLQPKAAQDWLKMQEAASAEGLSIKLGDSHREYDDQAVLFQKQISKRGSEKDAAVWSAPPGYSEHHTGWALDVANSSGKLIEPDSSEAKWIANNASRYNFEVSFPKGNAQGVGFEPWHLRHTSTEAKQAVGLLGSQGQDLVAIAPTLKEYITKSQVDFIGAGKALSVNSPSKIANEASNYQSTVKECGAGGSCSASGRMINPLPGGYITSEFGYRIHPIYGTSRLHAGIDVATQGSTVIASDCGKAFTDWESGYGNVVLIDHGKGMWTRSAHLAKHLIPNGTTVKQKQPVGIEGTTGGSTGIHLHFETRRGDRWGEPINPRNFVAF